MMKKITNHFLIFIKMLFIFAFIGALFSGTIKYYTLPTVEIESVSKLQSSIKSIVSHGKVQYPLSDILLSKDKILIKNIMVSENERFEEGDLIFTYVDLSDDIDIDYRDERIISSDIKYDNLVTINNNQISILQEKLSIKTEELKNANELFELGSISSKEVSKIIEAISDLKNDIESLNIKNSNLLSEKKLNALLIKKEKIYNDDLSDLVCNKNFVFDNGNAYSSISGSFEDLVDPGVVLNELDVIGRYRYSVEGNLMGVGYMSTLQYEELGSIDSVTINDESGNFIGNAKIDESSIIYDDNNIRYEFIINQSDKYKKKIVPNQRLTLELKTSYRADNDNNVYILPLSSVRFNKGLTMDSEYTVFYPVKSKNIFGDSTLVMNEERLKAVFIGDDSIALSIPKFNSDYEIILYPNADVSPGKKVIIWEN